MPQSCLYLGEVMHLRLRPFRHRFAYRVFSLLVDLDRLVELDRRLRLFSYNRFNLLSFHDRDHGPRDGTDLREWVERALTRHGISLAGGPIYLHCFPRLFGYVFNPLSIYFCYHADGRLAAILYEVKNTFGGQHGYVLGVDGAVATAGPIRHDCRKVFYVSPFIAMDARYRFRLMPPEEHLSVLIRESVAEGEVLVASHRGRREALDDRRLLAAVVRHPLMTLKVIAAIHWQALLLWRKGARFLRRPAPPEIEVGR